jgi:hypothetical protein
MRDEELDSYDCECGLGLTDDCYLGRRTDMPKKIDSDEATGWFVGVIVALALLAIAYLVFSASQWP